MPIKDVSGHTLQQLISLKGKTAVVTGSARGIGFAIARRLAEAGASVVIGDMDVPGAVTAARKASDQGIRRARRRRGAGRARGRQHRRAGRRRAVSEFGRLDIWVNNAGIFPGSPTVDQTVDIWDKVQDINLRGTFIGAREAARRMIAQEPKGRGDRQCRVGLRL